MDGMYTIEQIRVKLGYSKKEMAEKLGIHYQSYRNKIKGIHPWKVDEVATVSKIANIAMDKVAY